MAALPRVASSVNEYRQSKFVILASLILIILSVCGISVPSLVAVSTPAHAYSASGKAEVVIEDSQPRGLTMNGDQNVPQTPTRSRASVLSAVSNNLALGSGHPPPENKMKGRSPAALPVVQAVSPAMPQSGSDGGLSFRVYTAGSLQHSEVEFCDGKPERSAKNFTSIPAHLNMLFILGAQKAGTTWLFNALKQHPTFVGAAHAYKQGPNPWSKEVHFFNRWPMPPPEEFLKCFPRNITQRPPGALPDRVLVDGTPEYLFHSVAAPRVKAVVPQGRFVIILRDPVARAYSAWQMTKRALCSDDEKECPVEPFPEQVEMSLERQAARGCLFNTPSNERTWHSCFKCHFTLMNATACTSADYPTKEALRKCQEHKGHGMLSVSNYAPQIAWWLSFFPPERFLVVSSQHLRDTSSRMKVLNRILQHSGAKDAEPFTKKMLSRVKGFNGNYSLKTSPEESKAIAKLRQVFDKPMEDLTSLLALHHLDEFFTGLEPEIS